MLSTPASGGISGIAFSPDGTLALAYTGITAANTTEDHVQFWDVTNPDAPALRVQFVLGADGGPTSNALAFSGNGQLLATGSGRVLLWRTHADAEAVCRSVGDVITPAQWAKYIPDEPYNPPCGS